MSHQTIVHQLMRPPVRLAARAGVTPNQLTLLRLLTGLGAATCFAGGGRSWPVLGAGALLLSLLLDRADGQLARATGRVSTAGCRYDLLADGVSTVAVFVGMGMGARARWGDVSALYGAVAALSIVVLFLLTQRLEPAAASQAQRAFDPDDALLATPFLVWAGLMPWTVLLAAVLSPLAALWLAGVLLFRRRKAPVAGRTPAASTPAARPHAARPPLRLKSSRHRTT